MIFGSPGFIDIVKRDEIDPEVIAWPAQALRDQDLDLSKSRMLTVIIRVGREPVGWSLGNEMNQAGPGRPGSLCRGVRRSSSGTDQAR